MKKMLTIVGLSTVSAISFAAENTAVKKHDAAEKKENAAVEKHEAEAAKEHLKKTEAESKEVRREQRIA